MLQRTHSEIRRQVPNPKLLDVNRDRQEKDMKTDILLILQLELGYMNTSLRTLT